MSRLTLKFLFFLILMCAMFPNISAQRRAVTAINIERISTSFVDDGANVDIIFNESPASYAANSTLNININGTPQLPISALSTSKPNTLSFKIPKNTYNNSAQVEFQALIRDAQNREMIKSPWSQLDLSFSTTIENQREELGKLRGEKLTWSTKESEYTQQIAGLKSENEILTGQYQATQFDLGHGIKTFSTDTKIIIAVKLNLIGDVIADLTCKDCGSTSYDKTNQISTRNGDISLLRFENLPAGKNYKIKISILDVKTKTPYARASPNIIDPIATSSNQVDSLSITGTADTKLQQVDNKDEKLTMKFDASDEGFVYFTYAERIGSSTATPKTFGEFTTNQFGQPTGKIPVKKGENTVVIEGLTPGKTYNVVVNGMNKFGNQTANIANKDFTVPKNKTLDFDKVQPIAFNVSPLGMTLSWKANMKPEKAEFLIEYPNPADTSRKLITTAPSWNISDDFVITATMPVNSAFSIGDSNNKNKQKEKAANQPIENPVIIARMITDGGKTVIEQRIQMVYRIPTKAEVTQNIQGTDPASENLRKDLFDAIDAYNSDNKKIPWGKFLKAGFSFLIKVAL